MSFKEYTLELENKIVESYVTGVTLDEAEKLAGEFLAAQFKVSRELKKASLDARMRKSGVKAVRAGVYLDIVTKSEKKPTESMLDAMVNTNEIVQKEQDEYDITEVDSEELERVYNILQQAHVYFRQMSRGVQG